MAEDLDAAGLGTWSQALAALTEEGQHGDPRGPCGAEQIDAAREMILAWPEAAGERLRRP